MTPESPFAPPPPLVVLDELVLDALVEGAEVDEPLLVVAVVVLVDLPVVDDDRDVVVVVRLVGTAEVAARDVDEEEGAWCDPLLEQPATSNPAATRAARPARRVRGWSPSFPPCPSRRPARSSRPRSAPSGSR